MSNEECVCCTFIYRLPVFQAQTCSLSMNISSEKPKICHNITIHSSHPPLFVFAFSLCLSPHILTLSSCGAVGGSGEEMTGSRTMEGSCQLPAIAQSHLPQLQKFSLYHQQTDWEGGHCKLVYSFILQYKHSNGKNREKEKLRVCACH